MCHSLDKHNKKDIANLFENLADNFAEIVQYNKNNRYYDNPERSLVTLESLCDIMTNKSIPTSVIIFYLQKIYIHTWTWAIGIHIKQTDQ